MVAARLPSWARSIVPVSSTPMTGTMMANSAAAAPCAHDRSARSAFLSRCQTSRGVTRASLRERHGGRQQGLHPGLRTVVGGQRAVAGEKDRLGDDDKAGVGAVVAFEIDDR